MKEALRVLVAVALLGTFAGPAAAEDFDHSHEVYSTLLNLHVTNGLVDYKALKAKSAEFNGYLNALARVTEGEFNKWSEAQQLAFYFNLYNAATLKLIIDHYPVGSIKDIGHWLKGPWDQEVVRLFGKTITLNNLEHDLLRKEYNEPRLHMALVCAAKGCPPLRSEAYVGERLDEQLDDQSSTYLKTPRGLVLDRATGVARISSIFKWYGEDFTSVRAFVEKHSGKSLKGFKIRYLDYDWSLNKR